MRILLSLIVIIFALSIPASAQTTGNKSLDSLLKRDPQGPNQPQGKFFAKGLDIYALDNDNTIYMRRGNSNQFGRIARIPYDDGQVIGIDFRPADGPNGWLYAITDQGFVHMIDVDNPGRGNTQRLASISPRFAGGVQSLMDFNPVVNALRLIGSNDQNFALVGANLNQTVPQTAIAYAAGDVNAGADPNLCGGAYTNNFVGAANTIFYALDFDLDVLVTIATKNATGSSNTGGGQLQTIGQIITEDGTTLPITPTADIDIYTDSNGNNTIVGISGRTLFTIDLAQINPNLALGTTQQVNARTFTLGDVGGGFIDVAVGLNAQQ